MPTPTRSQARKQYDDQRKLSVAALLAIRQLFATARRPTIPQITATASRYQLAAATTSTRNVAALVGDAPDTVASAFTGVTSHGFPLTEPIIATIDRHVAAPVEPLPQPWWDDAQSFMADLEQLLLSEIADAGRTASQVEFTSRPEWTNYVRVLNPPSCKRCVPLAGRIYRDLTEFKRHPGCDCVMVPVENWEQAHEQGYAFSPREAFDKGYIRDLTASETKAIQDGADITKVINSSRGMTTPTMFGHRVKATTAGTTARAQWRRQNPTRLVRLRPESIYQFAKDRQDAIRLLGIYGYL